MTLSIPVARSLVILPIIVFATLFVVAEFQINRSLATALFFLLPFSCLPALYAVYVLWKRETIALRWTWFGIFLTETILVAAFLIFMIQLIIGLDAAMAELRFKIMFGPFIWLFHELHFDR